MKSTRGRGRPRLDDVAELETALLDVALEEFLQHGYGGASLTRIVKAAGISKTTLYSRFDSKEALFRAIMDRLNDRAAGMASLRPLPDTLDLEQGLESFANRMLELSLSGDLRDVNRLIYSESQRFPELGVAAAERMQLGVETVSRFIRECADAEQRRIRDPDCVAEAFVLMIRGWYVNVMLMGRDVSKSERERWVECAVHAMVSDWSDW